MLVRSGSVDVLSSAKASGAAILWGICLVEYAGLRTVPVRQAKGETFGVSEAKCVWHVVFTLVSGLERQEWRDRSWPGADEETILQEAAARGYRAREWCVRYA